MNLSLATILERVGLRWFCFGALQMIMSGPGKSAEGAWASRQTLNCFVVANGLLGLAGVYLLSWDLH